MGPEELEDKKKYQDGDNAVVLVDMEVTTVTVEFGVLSEAQYGYDLNDGEEISIGCGRSGDLGMESHHSELITSVRLKLNSFVGDDVVWMKV